MNARKVMKAKRTSKAIPSSETIPLSDFIFTLFGRQMFQTPGKMTKEYTEARIIILKTRVDESPCAKLKGKLDQKYSQGEGESRGYFYSYFHSLRPWFRGGWIRIIRLASDYPSVKPGK